MDDDDDFIDNRSAVSIRLRVLPSLSAGAIRLPRSYARITVTNECQILFSAPAHSAWRVNARFFMAR